MYILNRNKDPFNWGNDELRNYEGLMKEYEIPYLELAAESSRD